MSGNINLDTEGLAGVFQEETAPEGRLKVSFGPQHPGSGHMRIILTVNGDIVEDAVPDVGYVHRGVEKMCEYKNYIQNIPHIERPAIHDSSGTIFPYILAVERLLDLTEKVPERAQYIRVIMAELNRMINHFYFFGILGIFMGHTTPITWGMGDRDYLIDVAAMATGARVTFSYFVPGGVRTDLPYGFEDRLLKTCDYIQSRIPAYKAYLEENPFARMRLEGVGVIKRRDAIALGLAGPTLRGSGVKSDVRMDEPYSLYDTLDFEVPTRDEGDAMARMLVHFEEVKQSLSIVRQAVKKLRPGPVKIPLRGQIRGKVGDAYARTEGARGMNSYYIISDGQVRPYRVRVNTGDSRNLAAMPLVLIGGKVADVPVAHWSLDYWPVAADR
jgi:NADH-quinone oxidoreductase subunit D